MSSRLIIKAMAHPDVQQRFIENPLIYQELKGAVAVFVEVSVTSVFGVPKTSLKDSDFTVFLIAAPDPKVKGANVLFFIEENLPGFYALILRLVGPETLLEGEYIFAIVVHASTTKSVARGQTLVAFKA